MENPVKEISGVIHLLTQSPPSRQRETIQTYFTPNASFTHPFCRTGSWENSRVLLQAIYRWYKIMSPRIEMTVNSIAYDEPNLTLYVDISQVFRIFIIPFYRAPVRLVTVLKLSRSKGDGKYYIESQNDLYQVDQIVKFVAPGSWVLVWLWQFWATFFCLLGGAALWPVSVVEELVGRDGALSNESRNKGSVNGIEMLDLERKSKVDG